MKVPGTWPKKLIWNLLMTTTQDIWCNLVPHFTQFPVTWQKAGTQRERACGDTTVTVKTAFNYVRRHIGTLWSMMFSTVPLCILLCISILFYFSLYFLFRLTNCYVFLRFNMFLRLLDVFHLRAAPDTVKAHSEIKPLGHFMDTSMFYTVYGTFQTLSLNCLVSVLWMEEAACRLII